MPNSLNGGLLDKKGISAEKARNPYFDQTPKLTKYALTSGITGNKTRDTGIRQKGLQTRYDYLKIQRNYAPSKAMRCCSMYTVQSLVKEDTRGKYTLVKEKGSQNKIKHYLTPESIEKIPDMKLKVSQFGSSLTGLQTCDNPYCCMCARTKSMQRSETIQGVLKHTDTLGYGQYFVTLTIQRQGDAKKAIKELQTRWRKVQKALQYRFQKKNGFTIDFIRAVDVTFKPQLSKINQCYHIHLHTIILINQYVPVDQVREIVLKSWCRGGDASIRVNEDGQDVQDIRDTDKISRYVSKMAGLGLELAHSQTKKGLSGSMSLPQIMEAIADGKTHLVRLYEEFLTSMKNVRTMSYSANILQLYKDFEEHQEALADEYGVKEESQKERDIIIPEHWHKIFISMQSLIVQGAFYWLQRSKYKQRQEDVLKALLIANPIDKLYCLEEWLQGTLTIEQII
jgi:hypothetical protein